MIGSVLQRKPGVEFNSPLNRSFAIVAALSAVFARSVAGGPPPPPPMQIFFLDFDTYNDGDPLDHDYTLAERDQIALEMNAHFAPFNVLVVTTEPAFPPYSTIFLNGDAGGGAEAVDFHNEDKNDDAWINAKEMLSVVGFSEPEMTSERIVRASINVGMHESLHLLGARHQDDFTPPGTGLNFPGLGSSYDPVYPGPAGASLSGSTFMGLTLTFGLTADKLLQEDKFISPRTAMKIMLGSVVPVVAQAPDNIDPPHAQMLPPMVFEVPNTFPPDLVWSAAFPSLPHCVNVTDLRFIASVSMVKGSLKDPPLNPPNYYKIPTDLPPGATILPPSYTAEVYSIVIANQLSPINTAMYILDPGPPMGPGFLPLDYYGDIAHNSHGIEGGDPAIVDLLPPPYPVFIVEVGAESPPSPDGADYELIVYSLNLYIPPCGPGDLNCDGMVDNEDRALLCAALGSVVGDPNFQCRADFNSDDAIDQFDQMSFDAILPPCLGDIVTSATFMPPPDGIVDGADLAVLLGAWGHHSSCADFVTSRTFALPPDGNVDGADLAVLLGAWGACE